MAGFRGRDGYTMLEMIVVVTLLLLSLAVASASFSAYQQRTTARRAAQIFAQDLSLARSTAVRSRGDVIVAFDEADLGYSIRTAEGDTLVSRSFEGGQDLVLSALDLRFPGDSLVFDSRGVGDLSGITGSLGRAVFEAGNTSYEVSFNSMGASRVDGS